MSRGKARQVAGGIVDLAYVQNELEAAAAKYRKLAADLDGSAQAAREVLAEARGVRKDIAHDLAEMRRLAGPEGQLLRDFTGFMEGEIKEASAAILNRTAEFTDGIKNGLPIRIMCPGCEHTLTIAARIWNSESSEIFTCPNCRQRIGIMLAKLD